MQAATSSALPSPSAPPMLASVFGAAEQFRRGGPGIFVRVSATASLERLRPIVASWCEENTIFDSHRSSAGKLSEEQVTVVLGRLRKDQVLVQLSTPDPLTSTVAGQPVIAIIRNLEDFRAQRNMSPEIIGVASVSNVLAQVSAADRVQVPALLPA